MASLGATRADYAAGFFGNKEELVEVWPDNWTVFTIFEDLSTQWLAGPGGPIGLNYGSIKPVLGFRGIKRNQRRAIFDDLRIMETAALKQMTEK